MKRQEPGLDYEHGPVAGVLLRPKNGFVIRDDLLALEDLDAKRSTPPQKWLMPVDRAMEGYAIFRRYSLLYDFERLASAVGDLLEGADRRSSAVDRVAGPVLAFARRYGHLDRTVAVVEPGPSAKVEHGEPLQSWVDELARFRELRQLEQALLRNTERDREMLRSRISWSPRGVVYTRPLKGITKRVEMIAAPLIDPNAWTQLRRNDWRSAIDYYVCRTVNRKLIGKINPTVLPFAGHRMRFFATTLLSAIYYELARELAGKGRDVMEVECGSPVCEQLFRPARRDQRYHSNACRALAGYYRRASSKRRRSGSRSTRVRPSARPSP